MCSLAEGGETFPKSRAEVEYPVIFHIFSEVLDPLATL